MVNPHERVFPTDGLYSGESTEAILMNYLAYGYDMLMPLRIPPPYLCHLLIRILPHDQLF